MNDLMKKYGWQAIETKIGFDLISRRGIKVAYVQIKKDKYIFYDATNFKLLSGNKNVVEAAEELLLKYYFAEPLN